MSDRFGGECAHCGTYREILGGYAQGVRLCHPDVGMDCYRLVTVYGEPIGARKPHGELHDTADPIVAAELRTPTLERWGGVLNFLSQR